MTHQRNYPIVAVGLVLAWLFVVFSFIVSNQVGVDWFSRSGAVMCLLAAAANFSHFAQPGPRISMSMGCFSYPSAP